MVRIHPGPLLGSPYLEDPSIAVLTEGDAIASALIELEDDPGKLGRALVFQTWLDRNEARRRRPRARASRAKARQAEWRGTSRRGGMMSTENGRESFNDQLFDLGFLTIAAGLNAKTVITLIGHASIAITFDRYGYLFPGPTGGCLALAGRRIRAPSALLLEA